MRRLDGPAAFFDCVTELLVGIGMLHARIGAKT